MFIWGNRGTLRKSDGKREKQIHRKSEAKRVPERDPVRNQEGKSG